MNHLLAVLFLLLLFAACKQPSRHSTVVTSPPPEQKAVANVAGSAIAACSLVTTEEVGAIQGATITDGKSSVSPSGKVLMSHCYYSSNEPNLAVSLAVIQPSNESTSGAEARDYWANRFGSFAGESSGEKEGNGKKVEKGEEKERAAPPKKIDGIGEQAYWSGNRFGGALYLLKNNVIVRVSVGGPGSEEDKIRKSKAIAQKAIERLSTN
jgi:hypothetical protein